MIHRTTLSGPVQKTTKQDKNHFETVGVGGFSVNFSTVTELAQFYPHDWFMDNFHKPFANKGNYICGAHSTQEVISLPAPSLHFLVLVSIYATVAWQ